MQASLTHSGETFSVAAILKADYRRFYIISPTSESWTMLAEDRRALGVFEREVLRTIFGGVQNADGVWRKRISHALLGEPTITHMVKIGRLRWTGQTY